MSAKIEFRTPSKNDLKGLFKADMHVHTKYSFDSNTDVIKLLKKAKKLSIHLAITDHNRIGGVVEAMNSSYKELVIPGIELTSKENKDIIAYFYEFKDLKNFFDKEIKPFIKKKNSLRLNKLPFSLIELVNMLKKEKCLLSMPHPFIRGPKGIIKFKNNEELIKKIDLVEVINEKISYRSNLIALGWARLNEKSMVAGTDAHLLNRAGMALTAAKAASKKDFLNKLKIGEVILIGDNAGLKKNLVGLIKITAEKAKIRKNKKIDKKSL